MPSLKIWRNEELQRLKDESDRLFERLCTDFGLPSVCRPLLESTMNVYETPESIIIEVALPGATVDSLDVIIDSAMLVIRCTQATACTDSTASSVYERRYMLPCKVKTEEVAAEFSNDILRITMPKCTRPPVRRIPVTTGAAG